MGEIVSVNDILITPLKRIEVTGGDVMHGLKNTDAGYQGFGEAYFSWIEKDCVKAWKQHTRMTLNLIVPVGEIRFVFFSPDDVSNFRTEIAGVSRYVRITVPPGLWFGFHGIGEGQSLLLNVANIQHEPEEVHREMLTVFPYDWDNYSK